MPSGSRIRAATPEDAEAIARVHTASWQAGYRGIIAQDYLDTLRWEERHERWVEILGRTDPARVDLVGLAGDTVVGFSCLGPTREPDLELVGAVELYAIYVDAQEWGTGLADELLVDSLAGAVGTPCTLWVLADNLRARRFYERHGFVPDGTTRTEEIGGSELDEVRYRRNA